MYFTTIRGPGGSGKTTVADMLIKEQNKKDSVLLLDADFLWHEVVNKKNPTNLYTLLGNLVQTYAKENVSLVLEGMLSAKNEKGILLLNDVYDIAAKENAKINKFFLTAPREVLHMRESKKYAELGKKFNEEDFNEWLEKSTPESDEIVITTTEITPQTILEKITNYIYSK
jgi:adenylylsulfate kinase-like enzyme